MFCGNVSVQFCDSMEKINFISDTNVLLFLPINDRMSSRSIMNFSISMNNVSHQA